MLAKFRQLPAQEWLKERMTYNPETGEMTWISKSPHYANRFPAGRKVGHHDKESGYRYTRLPGKPGQFKTSRLIWMYMTGEDPKENIIDHWDKDVFNERWGNLRKVDGSANTLNSKIGLRCKSGIRGVYYIPHRKYWGFHICRKHKSYRKAGFPTKESAAVGYEQAEQFYEKNGYLPQRSSKVTATRLGEDNISI